MRSKIIQRPSSIRVGVYNGHGSTNTKIRRFATIYHYIGTAITYADSPTLGASFTINEFGIYAITYNDRFAAPSNMGITLNSTQLTTNVEDVTDKDVLAINYEADSQFQVNWTGPLNINDIVRAHTRGLGDFTSGTQAAEYFTIVKCN